jgi:hypothetical protein
MAKTLSTALFSFILLTLASRDRRAMAPFCLGRLSTRAATFLGRLFDRRLMAAKDDYGDASHRSALATFRPPPRPRPVRIAGFEKGRRHEPSRKNHGNGMGRPRRSVARPAGRLGLFSDLSLCCVGVPPAQPELVAPAGAAVGHPACHEAHYARRCARADRAALAAHFREKATWRVVAKDLKAAQGADTAEVSIALRMALSLEGVECQPT